MKLFKKNIYKYIIIIIIIINLLFQTIVHMDIKNIYKTHIINKLKIITTNGNQ